MPKIQLDYDSLNQVMSNVYHTDDIYLDELLPLIEDSYLHAIYAHGLSNMPESFSDCINLSNAAPGPYLRNSCIPLITTQTPYGIVNDNKEGVISVIGEMTFPDTQSMAPGLASLNPNDWLVPRTIKQKTRPTTAFNERGEFYYRFVTDHYILYKISNGIRIKDILDYDKRKMLTWNIDKKYVMYEFLLKAAVEFMSSFLMYKNAKAIMSNSGAGCNFENMFPGLISESLQDILLDEEYSIFSPLYQRLGCAKVYNWAYYDVRTNGPILTIKRKEDYRICEWYKQMFEYVELEEYTARSKEHGYG